MYYWTCSNAHASSYVCALFSCIPLIQCHWKWHTFITNAPHPGSCTEMPHPISIGALGRTNAAQYSPRQHACLCACTPLVQLAHQLQCITAIDGGNGATRTNKAMPPCFRLEFNMSDKKPCFRFSRWRSLVSAFFTSLGWLSSSRS